MMNVYGYCRISTKKEMKKQSMERQEHILNEFSKENNFVYEKIYTEDMTGKDLDRPVFNVLTKEILRAGDLLVVSDLDRIGRNADSVISFLKMMKSRGIGICILDTPYLNDFKFVTAADEDNKRLFAMSVDIIITIKAHMAEQERLKISERTRNALAAKKAKGVKLGRPESPVKDLFIEKYPLYRDGVISMKDILAILGISRNQFYVLKRKYIKE